MNALTAFCSRTRYILLGWTSPGAPTFFWPPNDTSNFGMGFTFYAQWEEIVEPEPEVDVFTVDGITYKVLTPPESGNPGTVQVGEGTDRDHRAVDTSVVEVVIPDSVDYLGNTYTVTSIGGYAFSDCSRLESVEIPDGVTSIGSDAFMYCRRLESVNIPEGVTSIGGWAFFYCVSLESVNIPESVTSISHYAFRNCDNLSEVYFDGNAPTDIPGQPFSNIAEGAVAWVYRAATGFPAEGKLWGELIVRYRDAAPPADYTELDAVLEYAMSLDEEEYTEESWAALMAAVAEVLALDRNLTDDDQYLIDNAVDSIDIAIDSLEWKPIPPLPPEVVAMTTDASCIACIVENSKGLWTVTFIVTVTCDDGSTEDVEYTVTIPKNGDGTIDMGDSILVYDIKGNGSNVKVFRIEMK